VIKINGVAHTNITVSNWEACRAFYDELLPFLGLQRVFDGADFVYYVGARTAMGIGRCDPQYENERFVQNRVGLHHHCFRARSRDDVEQVHTHLVSIGAAIVHAPEDGGWAPGYYSVLFEDPAGTRLEVNFVPGHGVLAAGAGFDPSGDYD
jgi:catechol 2,3-dioxygenase-like lactoylglutathione lyase family enzyme